MSPLLELLRTTPGRPDAVRIALGGMNSMELAREAARHGLSGLARHELEHAQVPISAEAASVLKRDGMAIAASALKVKRLLFRSLEALAARGIIPVLLKGYGLAKRLYPDPLYRPMTDVDLLVARDELVSAEVALSGIGVHKHEALERFELEHHHHLNFYGPAGAVELHFRPISGFGGAMDGEALMSRAISATLESQSLRYLKPEDELAYLATHATQHLFKGIGWLYDLKLFIHHYPDLDWSTVVRTSQESEMEGPVYFALQTAREGLRADVPESVLRALRPWRWQAILAKRFFSGDRLVAAPFAYGNYSALIAPFLTSNLRRATRAGLYLAWRVPLRKFARHFPKLAPEHWRT